MPESGPQHHHHHQITKLSHNITNYNCLMPESGPQHNKLQLLDAHKLHTFASMSSIHAG
jgi:hypothetical protein